MLNQIKKAFKENPEAHTDWKEKKGSFKFDLKVATTMLSSTNVSGDTYDLVVEPMVRRIDITGQEVIYTSPKGVFMLTSSDQANWAIRSKANLSDISLDFIEV